MATRLALRRKITIALLAGVATLACLVVDGGRVAAFRGGFGGFRGGGFGGFHGGGFGGFGGFHGGGFQGHGFDGFNGGASRFGDGGFTDRSIDSGFGRGGWGSIHSADTFNDRADTFQQSHPEFHNNVSQYQQIASMRPTHFSRTALMRLITCRITE
jgi:hypothetical protein